MTIWQLRADDDYNSAFLVDQNGDQCYDNGEDFLEIKANPYIRELMIEKGTKGFPDIMYYGGILGSCVVSNKAKSLIEYYFSELAIQFIPCSSKQYPNVKMWILNVCEYHDVFDVENSIYKTLINHKGEKRISYINKYAFTKEAFEYGLFKIFIDGYKSPICLYVSDRFKTIMEENGVTGLDLENIYSI